MKLAMISLFIILSSASVLNAAPSTVLIKNETNQPSMIGINMEYSLMRGISGTQITSQISKKLEKNSEIDIINWLISPQSRIGHTLSIKKLTITINGTPIDLGNHPSIRIIIFQDGSTIDTRIEPLSTFTVARMATIRWWTGTKASWSSFWKKLFKQ